MQAGQSGEISASSPFPGPISRSRLGTRGTMRVTNRYTMPPLEPRIQHPSALQRDARFQEFATSAYHMEPLEPLSSVEEDAWLNDVLPPTSPGPSARSGNLSAKDTPVLPGERLWTVVHSLSERVCQELARRQMVVQGNDVEVARECAVDILRAETTLANQIYNLAEAEQVMQAVIDEVAGFGPLAALWRDDAVTEIMAVGPRLTIVERNGDMQEVSYHFEDEQHMLGIVGNILRAAGHTFDPSVAITNARLLDNTFVNIVMPPAAVKGPTLTMRRRRRNVPTLAELVKLETLSQPMADFLRRCVEARLNIVICGGLRSGRTTLLNALASCIPGTQRIVTLEDVAELQLTQKQVVALEARLMTSHKSERAKGDNGNMRDLLLCALHMRPERVIVEGCQNDVAGILLSALHTGYDGSLFTLYANGLRDCLGRLEMTCMASGSAMPVSVTREQVARAIHLVIYLARLSNGARKVMNIAQVVGTRGDKITTRSIFHYQENSEGQGTFEPGGFVPTCAAELRQGHAPADLFMAQTY